MTNTPRYPNGMPVSLREVWDIVDQLGLALKENAQVKAKAKALNMQPSLGLNADTEADLISERNRHMTYLVNNHGDKLKPQARYTIVTKGKNEKGRHYRKGEFRLFIGQYSAFIIEIGITPDNLDVDPKKLRRVLQITDDTPFRAAQTAEERKNLVKQFVTEKL